MEYYKEYEPKGRIERQDDRLATQTKKDFEELIGYQVQDQKEFEQLRKQVVKQQTKVISSFIIKKRFSMSPSRISAFNQPQQSRETSSDISSLICTSEHKQSPKTPKKIVSPFIRKQQQNHQDSVSTEIPSTSTVTPIVTQTTFQFLTPRTSRTAVRSVKVSPFERSRRQLGSFEKINKNNRLKDESEIINTTRDTINNSQVIEICQEHPIELLNMFPYAPNSSSKVIPKKSMKKRNMNRTEKPHNCMDSISNEKINFENRNHLKWRNNHSPNN